MAQQGERGAEQLSDLLNDCFAILTDVVDAHGGDIVCFTGDGFLAVWDAANPAGRATLQLNAHLGFVMRWVRGRKHRIPDFASASVSTWVRFTTAGSVATAASGAMRSLGRRSKISDQPTGRRGLAKFCYAIAPGERSPNIATAKPAKAFRTSSAAEGIGARAGATNPGR